MDGSIDQQTAKELLSAIEKDDETLVRERATLFKDKEKMKLGILAQKPHKLLGEAYLEALCQLLSEPACAQLHKGRSSDDQSNFKTQLREAYNPSNDRYMRDWCPITGTWRHSDTMKAAHIIPHAIGEIQASYIFGLPVEKGYTVLWSAENGLLMPKKIEQAFDAARLVIVPASDSEGELKIVVLDDSLLSERFDENEFFRDLHQKTLDFQTDSRPGRRHLYLHFLLTISRRRRFQATGWENDRQKVPGGIIWGTPGKWMNHGLLRFIAIEVGDLAKDQDFADLIGVDPEAISQLPQTWTRGKEDSALVVLKGHYVVGIARAERK